MLGAHTMKHWSSTQTSTALSSGEAEFAGVIRGSGQGLGYQALLEDLGINAPLRVWTDSSAAIGICSRQGLGKMRHLDTHTLWIQQAARSRRIDLRKVKGEENPADLLTKHSLTKAKLEYLVTLFGCGYCEGRPSSAPQLRRGESTKLTLAQAAGDVQAVISGDADGQRRDSSGTPAQKKIATATAATTLDEPAPRTTALDELAPRTPHLEMTEEELDDHYPRLQAPPEEPLCDVACD